MCKLITKIQYACQDYLFTQFSMSKMCNSFTLRCFCSPPKSTTRKISTFVKEKLAQGGGLGPVVSGELQVAIE